MHLLSHFHQNIWNSQFGETQFRSYSQQQDVRSYVSLLWIKCRGRYSCNVILTVFSWIQINIFIFFFAVIYEVYCHSFLIQFLQKPWLESTTLEELGCVVADMPLTLIFLHLASIVGTTKHLFFFIINLNLQNITSQIPVLCISKEWCIKSALCVHLSRKWNVDFTPNNKL